MTVSTTKLSSKGQVVIPKEIRDALRWKPGHELEILVTESGVLLSSPAPEKTGHDLADLIGMLRHDGPSVPIEEMCRPVDYTADWEDSERRSR